MELLCAPVLSDPLLNNQPTYVSYLVVAASSAFHNFSQLRGARVGYNDFKSLSGRYVLLDRLLDWQQETGQDPQQFFDQVVCTGGHSHSLQQIVNGSIDVAAIDTQLLTKLRLQQSSLLPLIRIVEMLKPQPIQPVTVTTALPLAFRNVLRDVFLNLHAEPSNRERLLSFGFQGFAAVHDSDYDPLRRLLNRCEDIHWLS